MIARPHRSRRAATIAAAALIATLLANAAAAPVWSAGPIARAAAPASTFAWSVPQVRELIGLIEAAKADGRDPDRYGLAALRSELELAQELWRTPGSRQLDMLSQTAALALAADYRGLDPVAARALAPSLSRALAQGRLGLWITAHQGAL